MATKTLPFDTLRSGLAGRIILPGDADYDSSRAVLYGGIDKKPAVMVRTRSVGDVKQAVDFARDNGLELAVRSGGHSAAGHSTTDGGLVVDMREMQTVEIDAAGKTAWAEAGVTAEQFTKAATEQGLVVGFGERVQVLLGGLDLTMTHAIHHGLEVRSAGEQPGCVRMSEVVHPDVETEVCSLECREPHLGPEGVA